MNFMPNDWGDTWIGAIVEMIGGFGPVVGGIVLIGAIIAGIVGYSMLHIAKGGGQYGIIEGYVGTIGSGKTTLAVQHALTLATARNACLLSNIPVVCNPRCKGWVRREKVSFGKLTMRRIRNRNFYDMVEAEPEHVIEHRTLPMNDEGLDLGELTRQAFRLRDEGRGLVLLMDEVGVIMPARLWKEFSVALMWVLQQSRKLACEWIWTAQDVSFVDHQLRSLTSVVHYMRCYPPPSIWRRAKGKRPWLLIASAFTPLAAPRANDEGGRRERRLGRRMLRYNRKWELAFDTDGVVLPSKHLKGAQVLISAVAETGDKHVINPKLSDWGELAQATPEPGTLPSVTGRNGS